MRELATRFPLARSSVRLLRRARARLPRPPRPVILMYHRIAADTFDPWGLCVTPGNFADQLRWLVANRTVLPLEDLCERHSAGTLPGDAAAITFDDGYESTATIAAPLLEQFHLPATVFLSAALVRHSGPFWWDELRLLILEHGKQSLGIDQEVVALGERRDTDAVWRPGEDPQTPRQQAFLHFWSVLQGKDPTSLREAMNELRSQARDLPRDGIEGPMSVDQVQAITSHRIRFGSHAMTHPSLPALSSSAKASEIADSIGACEKLTGARPLTFAYPYGRFDRESEQLVEAAGFQCACTTQERPVTRWSRRFAMPRMAAGNWPGERFGQAIARI